MPSSLERQLRSPLWVTEAGLVALSAICGALCMCWGQMMMPCVYVLALASALALLGLHFRWCVPSTLLIMLVFSCLTLPLLHEKLSFYNGSRALMEHTRAVTFIPLPTILENAAASEPNDAIEEVGTMPTTIEALVPTLAVLSFQPTADRTVRTKTPPRKRPGLRPKVFADSVPATTTTTATTTLELFSEEDTDQAPIFRMPPMIPFRLHDTWSLQEAPDPAKYNEEHAYDVAKSVVTLWDRETADPAVKGLYKLVEEVSQGSPEVRHIATSAYPLREFLSLVNRLPDQQRRSRLRRISELLTLSEFASSRSSRDVPESLKLSDEWGASTVLGALMACSNAEFEQLSRVVRRSEFMQKLTRSEFEMIVAMLEKVAGQAAQHPVQKNDTYEFIVSGRPLEEAPSTLITLLNRFQSFGMPRGLASPAWMRSVALDDLVGEVDEDFAALDRRLRGARRAVIFAMACMAGWALLVAVELFVRNVH